VASTVVSVPVGSGPASVAIGPDGGRAYVGNVADRTVSVVDLSLAQVAATIGVPGSPVGIGVASDGRIYVGTENFDVAGSGQIAVIDPSSAAVTAEIALGGSAGSLALLADGRLAVADLDVERVAIVDPREEATTALDLGNGVVPMSVAAGRSGDAFFVGARVDDTGALLLVDGGRVQARRDLDFMPGRAVASADGRLYLADPGHGRVHVIDAASATPLDDPIVVDDGVSDVELDPEGRLLYVVGIGRLWTLKTAAGHAVVGDPVPIGAGSTELAMTPDGRLAAVVDFFSEALLLVALPDRRPAR
jgi:YVTN family beta-propeller protein